MENLISIIIPVHNAEQYLHECIDSVIHQTYKAIEIILINDGSTDNSGAICDNYARLDNRIKVIHQANSGVSLARNAGLDVAQGEYITFIDSDDFVDKEYISAMHQKSREVDSDVTFCRFAKYVDGNIFAIEENIPDFIDVDIKAQGFIDFFCSFLDYKDNIFGSSCRVLFKKEIIQEIRFDRSIKISEDLLFLLSIILLSKRVASINNCLYFYRQASSSASHSYKKNFLNSQVVLYEELKKIFDSLNRDSLKVFQIHSCILCYYVFSNELKYKQLNWKSRIQEARESILYPYFKLKNGLRIYGLKFKLKFLIAWFIVKMRIA